MTMEREVMVPRIENDLGKVARFVGVPQAELTDTQIVDALPKLGHDSSVVVWERREAVSNQA